MYSGKADQLTAVGYEFMKFNLIEYRSYVIPVLIGGLAGFLYYKFVGCSSGGCAISSNPWSMTLYGMLLGSLFPINQKSEKQQEKSITT